MSEYKTQYVSSFLLVRIMCSGDIRQSIIFNMFGNSLTLRLKQFRYVETLCEAHNRHLMCTHINFYKANLIIIALKKSMSLCLQLLKVHSILIFIKKLNILNA